MMFLANLSNIILQNNYLKECKLCTRGHSWGGVMAFDDLKKKNANKKKRTFADENILHVMLKELKLLLGQRWKTSVSVQDDVLG